MSYLQNAVNRWNEEAISPDDDQPLEFPVEKVEEATKSLSIMFDSYVHARRRCRLLFQTVGALTAIEIDATNVPTTPAYL